MLRRLVAFPTVSSDSNLELIDYVSSVLVAAGFRITTTSNHGGDKVNIFATIGPEGDGGIVLSGHTDVVPVEGQHWTTEPFAALADDERVWGRGTADMKGFIACVLAVVSTIKPARLLRPLHVALTYDEEEGCHGAKVMLEELARIGPQPEVAIIGEPTAMRVVEAHKGCYEFTTTITAGEQHASTAASGSGAIHAAAEFIRMLDLLASQLTNRAQADSPFSPPGATINVGTIRGGVARNITAASSEFEWELRSVAAGDVAFVTQQVDRFVADELLPAMRRRFSQAEVRTVTVGAVGPFQPQTTSAATVLAHRLTRSTKSEVVSFGTEAGLFQEAGISAVVCGPGRIDQAHRPDEYIEINQLESCLDMLGMLKADLLAQDAKSMPV